MTGGIELVDPLDFVRPEGRLLIDTSVFMDDNPVRKGAITALLQRCGVAIRKNENPIVVPTDVVLELTRYSRKAAGASDEALRRAGVALEFIKGAEAQRLIRTDIGRPRKAYADSVFDALFEVHGTRYDMCLLVKDITPLLKVRLLAKSSPRRLVAGQLTKDGLIEVEGTQALYERGMRKLLRKQEEGDLRDVAELEPILAAFERELGVTPMARAAGTPHRVGAAPWRRDEAPTVAPFAVNAQLKRPDRVLDIDDIPGLGDKVHYESPSGSGTLLLETVLGEGGEGTAYTVEGNRVVKIFSRSHLTKHRKEKVTLLASRGLRYEGICFPEAVVTNASGHFVGYVMPRAHGDEFRVIMNPRRFLKAFPTWKKADLVDVCISFLEKLAYLHSLNVIVGDINPKNVIVDANKDVWIIDADSWQLEGYPCPVGTPMFTSPSALGKPYAESLRTMEDELFAVATMLFMVLITGQFPYARAGSDGDIVRLIKEGNFAFQVGERSNRDQPDGNWKYMWSHMPRDLKEMFWHTFHREGHRYASPPSAEDWLRAFRQYRWWLGSDKSFDPMSNDVYPFRFKAFRPDTPIRDCPQCGRLHAVVGDWNDGTQTYSMPDTCFDCRQQNRPRCEDCGSPKPAGALRDGRCRDCNRKRDFASCDRCGKEVPKKYLVDGRCSRCQLGTCKTCGTTVLKSELSYGRCAACETCGKTLDPNRLCTDCGQPFITFEHAEWFTGKLLDVAKSHAAIKKECPPRAAESRPARPRRTNSSSSSPSVASTSAAKPATRPNPGVWERFTQWWNS